MTDKIEKEQKVRKAYPGSYYDTPGLERWLEERAREGLRLANARFFDGLMAFRKTAPRRVRYFAAPVLDGKEKDRDAWEREIDALCEEAGWTLAFEKAGVVRIYESEDPWAVKPKPEISDEDWAEKEKKLWRQLAGWFISAVLVVVQAMLEMRKWTTGYADLLTYGLGMFLTTGLIPVLLSISGISTLYSIYILRRVHRNQERTEPRRGAVFVRWMGQIAPNALIALLLVCALIILPKIEFDYQPLGADSGPVPMVTVSLLAEEEAEEPDIFTGTRKGLLLPREVRVRSSWNGQGAFLWYGDGDHLEFCYYRLWNEDMARRLAEDEAFRENCAPLTDTGGFDEVWFAVDQYGGQFLVARTGDVAITVEYEGPGSLTEALPEIYQIIADYRASS